MLTTRWSLVALLGCLLWAQTERGNITGLISDPTGARLAGASLVITNRATNTSIAVSTTGTGEYNAPNLAPGVYRVEISAPGFKRFVQERVVLTAAGTVRLDAELQVGQVTETVEVTTDIAQLQTETAKISTAGHNRLGDELPLVVGGALRSPFDLVSITAEARGSGIKHTSMCGIAGIWGNSTEDRLRAMADLLRHRGPDD